MHSRRNTTLAFIALFGVTFFSAVQALAQEKSIVVASTTSTQDSGLFEYLLPIFQQKTGIAVKVIAQAPNRHSTLVGAVTPTSCSFTRNRQKRSFWLRDKA